MPERRGRPVAAVFLFLLVVVVAVILGVLAYFCLSGQDLGSLVDRPGGGQASESLFWGWVFVVGTGVVVIGGIWLVLRVGSGRRGARERP